MNKSFNVNGEVASRFCLTCNNVQQPLSRAHEHLRHWKGLSKDVRLHIVNVSKDLHESGLVADRRSLLATVPAVFVSVIA